MTPFRFPALAGLVVGAAALSLATPAFAAAPSASGLKSTVVAHGLSNPKYVATKGQDVWFGDSGRGGADCVTAIGVTGAPGPVCAGASGSVRRLQGTQLTTIASGIGSAIERDNGEIFGVMAVEPSGSRPVILVRDTLTTQTGSNLLPSGKAHRQFGKILRIGASGRLTTVANIARFQARHPQPGAQLGGLPGETTWDSDGHDIVAYRGGWAVADAGANDVVRVTGDGTVSLIARIPTIPIDVPATASTPATTVDAQAVPSSLTVGPDGAIYVGVLRGQPSPPGSARVYRVVPGEAPKVVVAGLTRVTDLAFRGKSLYILENNVAGGRASSSSKGALLRADLIAESAVAATPMPLSGLVDPIGLAFDQKGRGYITNNTGVVGRGELLRVTGLD